MWISAASAAEIERAYFKMALQFVSAGNTVQVLVVVGVNCTFAHQHPDKNDSAEAKVQFQPFHSFIRFLVTRDAERNTTLL